MTNPSDPPVPSCGVDHPVFARLYSALAPGAEKSGVGRHREELLAGLSGTVVEVGAGSGLNFGHYPPEVTKVVAVEPEPYLRAKAEKVATGAPVPVTVVAGTAQQIPAADEVFDAAVLSLVFCSVPDVPAALTELRRVLKPGGVVAYYEHVRSETPLYSRLQDAADVVWPHIGGGCHPNRDTPRALQRGGFVIEQQRRFHFQPCVLVWPVAPVVIGRARRP